MEGTRFRHFEIKGLLGRGGMGEVYLAVDHTLERQVALKFLPRDLTGDATAQGRLLDEARSCSRIQHPNIAIIHSIEEDGGIHALVMEYVQGRTLREVIARQQLSLSRVTRIGRAIAAGLTAAHEQGVIHRDLKPANVMLTNRGALKIMDFGLALRPERTVQTVGNKAYGTVNYMSPEQARGETPTAASDIFSYGTLLYELLTGECPFKGDNDLSVLQSIIHDEPRPLRSLRRDTPPALEAIIRRCMQKTPDERYSSMHEVAAELQYVEPDIEHGPKDLISELATGLNGDAGAELQLPNGKPRQREQAKDPGDGLPPMPDELNVPIADVLEALDNPRPESKKDERPSGFVFAPDKGSRPEEESKLAEGVVFDPPSSHLDPATLRRAAEVAREMPQPGGSGTAPQKRGTTSRRSRPEKKRGAVFVGGQGRSGRSGGHVSPAIGASPKTGPWKNLLGLVFALLIAIAGFLGLLHAAGVKVLPGQQLIEGTPADDSRSGNAALESDIAGSAAAADRAGGSAAAPADSSGTN